MIKSMKFIKLIVSGLLFLCLVQCRVYEKPAKLEDKLKDLCANHPAEFIQTGASQSFTKDDRATYGLDFRSRLSYLQVKNYYTKTFPTWKMLEQSNKDISGGGETRYLSFTNEPFSIHIQTSNLNEDVTEKSFSLDCSWNANW